MTDEADPTEIVELLADEYVRSIFDALDGGALTAPEVARRCGCSEATVYRRLGELEASGLVAVETEFDPDGHHRTRYRARPVRLSIEVDGDGLDGTIRRPERPDDRRHADREDYAPPRGSLAD